MCVSLWARTLLIRVLSVQEIQSCDIYKFPYYSDGTKLVVL